MYTYIYTYENTYREECLYLYKSIYRYTPREAAAANQMGGKAVAYSIYMYIYTYMYT
jgi:hypothetical protein